MIRKYIPENNARHKALDGIFFSEKKTGRICPYIDRHKEYYQPSIYTYNMNEHNFRSQEFHENTEMIVLGCSYTLGVGVPVDFTWPTFVSKLIGVNDFVNLGKAGCGIAYQVRMLTNYIRIYGAPKIVLCTFPELLRYEHPNEKGISVNCNTKGSGNEYGFNEEQSVSQSLIALSMLESICKAAKIKLVWQQWTNEKTLPEDVYLETFDSYISFELAGCFTNSHHDFEYDKTTNDYRFVSKTHEELRCCDWLMEVSNGCFDFGWDRYNVPKKYRNGVPSKEELDKLLLSTVNTKFNSFEGYGPPHFGSHGHWHLAENLAKNF
jgi:hypothetical protein